MDTAGLLVDAFDRIQRAVHQAVEGLSPEGLAFRPDGQANSIAWLVWHLTRIQDDHLADAEGREQTWTAGDWVGRFSLPLDPSDTGYGHTADHVAAVRVDSGQLLTGYYDDVHRQTVRFLERLVQGDLDRIVDRSWDPPVSLGVRLNSVLADDLEHAGQAAYVRGLLLRR